MFSRRVSQKWYIRPGKFGRRQESIAVPVLALIRREPGLDLTWVSILLSSITGIIAMGLAGNLISTHRTKKNFQKLKKAYLDPEFWDAKIEIEAYSIFEKETWAANRAKDKEKEGACHR